MDNVCKRCLFSIPSKVEMAEEQEYLELFLLSGTGPRALGNFPVRLATQSKSLRKFNLRHLRLLAGPFDQGLKPWPNGLASSRK